MLSSYKHIILILWIVQNEVIFNRKRKKFDTHSYWFFDGIVLVSPHVIMCNVSNAEHMHRILCRPPTITSWVATIYWLVLFQIKHRPCCGVTCLFKFCRKKSHALVDSLSTTTKAIGRILLLSSCATATRRVPLYLSYNHVPLTWTTSL